MLNNDGQTFVIDSATSPGNILLTITFLAPPIVTYYALQISDYNLLQYQHFSMPTFYLNPNCGGPAPTTLSIAYTVQDPALTISASTYFTTTLPFCPLTWAVTNIIPSNTFIASGGAFQYVTNLVTIYSNANTQTGIFTFDLIASTPT